MRIRIRIRILFGFEPLLARCTKVSKQAVCSPFSATRLEVPCSFTSVPDGPHTKICNILRVQKRKAAMYDKKTLKVPGKVAPLHVPQKGPYGERRSLSRADGLLIHLHLSESPKWSSPTKLGKAHVHCPRSHTWKERLHTISCGLVPKWIGNDTAISTPVPCSLQHTTFHLGLGRPEPR